MMNLRSSAEEKSKIHIESQSNGEQSCKTLHGKVISHFPLGIIRQMASSIAKVRREEMRMEEVVFLFSTGSSKKNSCMFESSRPLSAH